MKFAPSTLVATGRLANPPAARRSPLPGSSPSGDTAQVQEHITNPMMHEGLPTVTTRSNSTRAIVRNNSFNVRGNTTRKRRHHSVFVIVMVVASIFVRVGTAAASVVVMENPDHADSVGINALPADKGRRFKLDIHKMLRTSLNPKVGKPTATDILEESSQSDQRFSVSDLDVAQGLDGILATKQMIDDPPLETVASTIGAMSGIVGMVVPPPAKPLLGKSRNGGAREPRAKDVLEESSQSDQRFSVADLDVAQGLEGILATKQMIEDPSLETVADTIGAMSGIVGMVVPPPAGPLVGLGMGLFGGIFGSSEEEGTTNDDVITAVEAGFKKVLRVVEANFRKVHGKLRIIEVAVADLRISMEELTAMTQYNILAVEEIKQKLWVDPFHNIHAAYTNLIETFMPVSSGESWDAFFELANELRQKFQAEVYDAFEFENISNYLQWFEDADINGAGMCGVAMLFGYLTAVRAELFFITSMGSYVKTTEPSCDDTKFCWKPRPSVLLRYTTKYSNQMRELQRILSAESQDLGGLGIAHLVKMSSAELLKGIGSVPDTGFCFRCQKKESCREYKDFPIQQICATNDSTLFSCNPKSFYVSCVDRHGSGGPSHVRIPGSMTTTCCSCSCMAKTEYNDYFGGSEGSHELYDNHCVQDEEIIPFEKICSTQQEVVNVPESSRSYSSLYNSGYRASMLDSLACWAAANNAAGQWMQMDLGSVRQVSGVITQPRYGGKSAGETQAVTTFTVKYSSDGSNFETMPGTYSSAGGYNIKTTSTFLAQVTARYIRLVAVTWQDHVSLRAAVEITTCNTPVEVVNLPESSRSYSSVYNSDYRASMLDSHASCWAAANSAAGEWMQMDLGSARQVSGVITQPCGSYGQTVEAFTVQYSSDGSNFEVVPGTYRSAVPNDLVDNDVKTTSTFPVPVTARYIRLVAVTWHARVTLRAALEVIITPTEVVNVPESSRSYSSVHSDHRASMLDSHRCWAAANSAAGQWMQMDLGSARQVSGVITQPRYGGNGESQAVTTFTVKYSSDGSNFETMPGTYSSAAGYNIKTTSTFLAPVTARYIRLVAVTWQHHVSLRAALEVIITPTAGEVTQFD